MCLSNAGEAVGQGLRGGGETRGRPKMAINRDFPRLWAFSANFARDKIEEREIPQPMVKIEARFGGPRPSLGHFGRPAGPGRGTFGGQKRPAMAINRDLPGLCAFSATFEIEEREITHPMV